LYYPPPERWVENEYAYYVGPTNTNKVMDFEELNRKESK